MYTPIIKSKSFEPAPVGRFGIPAYADSVSNPHVVGTSAHEEWWNEQFRRCVDGYITGGIFIPGRYYYYLNFCYISTLLRGNHLPEYVDADLEFFNLVEEAKRTHKGIIVVKARRRGMSFKATAIVDHGIRFNHEGYNAGICAGIDKYSEGFFRKLKDMTTLKAPELQMHALKNNDEQLTFGWTEKTDGGMIDKGSKNTVLCRTMFRDPNIFKGERFNDVIFEEAGEFDMLLQGYGATKACFAVGNKMVGSPLIFGTGGNIKTGSKDFITMWHEAEYFDLLKFELLGPRLMVGFFSGSKNEQGKVEEDIPYIKKRYGKDEIIGMEDATRAEEIILETRKFLSKNKDKQKYYDYMQDNPLTVREAFLSFSGNSFDPEILAERRVTLSETSETLYGKYHLEWEKNEDGSIKQPLSVKVIPARDEEDERECILIRHHPLVNYKNLEVAGCLLPGEKVMTKRGLVDVEKVYLEDKLISENGDYVSIYNLQQYNLKNETTYKVKVSNTLRTTTFTGEHPLLVSKATRVINYKLHDKKYKFNEPRFEFDFKYKNVRDVKVGEWVRVPNIYIKPNDFDISIFWKYKYYRNSNRVESPLYKEDFWWLVGLWIGDGWCDLNKHKIYIAFNLSETEYVERFKKVVFSLFNREVYIRQHGENCLEASFSCKQLNEFLTKYFGKYATGKKLPSWAKHINSDCKKSLLNGYLNSDGCITFEKNRSLYSTHFISINLELLESMQDVLFSIGIVSVINVLREESYHIFSNNSKGSKTKRCYQLRLGNHDTINFVKKMLDVNKFEDSKLSRVDMNNLKKVRKRANDGCFIDDSLEYIYFQIRDIEKGLYSGVVYNFECETHTFMCHHITTHNCDAYDIDQTTTSKSLGAMLVLRRKGNPHAKDKKYPVCIYYNRPKRKETFYDNCLKIAVYYNLIGNVLIDYAKGAIIQYFKDNGGKKYLAKRPKAFESENSEQMHDYGVSINSYSKPKMISLMQSSVIDDMDEHVFDRLLDDLQNYDVAQKDTDWDLADAWGIALMRDIDMKRSVTEDNNTNKEDPFALPMWKTMPDGTMRDISKRNKDSKDISDPFLRMLEEGRFS